MKDRRNEGFEKICSILAEGHFVGHEGKGCFETLCKEFGVIQENAELLLYESFGMCSAEIIEVFCGQ